MRKFIIVLTVVAFSVAALLMNGYASDYQGDEKEESKSLFQKVGDLITGDYKVKGKAIKETGVVQVVADQITDLKPRAEKDAEAEQKLKPIKI